MGFLGFREGMIFLLSSLAAWDLGIGAQTVGHLLLLETPLQLTPTFKATDGQEQHSQCKQLHGVDGRESGLRNSWGQGGH